VKNSFNITPVGVVKSGRIRVFEEFAEALDGIKPNDNLILLHWLATEKSNSIEIAVIKIRKIDNNELHIKRLDIPNGTAIIDIKPYFKDLDKWLPYCFGKVNK
jgi:tRNA (Thr-GGU) A37 N-methylase